MKQRLDQQLASQGLVTSRSQAESYVKLGLVTINGHKAAKPGQMVLPTDVLKVQAAHQYVSRAALKLASVAERLRIDFKGKTMLDVGSSTGGFTQFALEQGAHMVLAVEVGTNQLHPSLRQDPRIELHEKTDIRDFQTEQKIDLVVADVSFISLRELLPSIKKLCHKQTDLILMVKPQFEAAADNLKHKGVIKNDKIRREILKNFETWAVQHGFYIVDKADSDVAGGKGNLERFYHLKIASIS